MHSVSRAAAAELEQDLITLLHNPRRHRVKIAQQLTVLNGHLGNVFLAFGDVFLTPLNLTQCRQYGLVLSLLAIIRTPQVVEHVSVGVAHEIKKFLSSGLGHVSSVFCYDPVECLVFQRPFDTHGLFFRRARLHTQSHLISTVCFSFLIVVLMAAAQSSAATSPPLVASPLSSSGVTTVEGKHAAFLAGQPHARLRVYAFAEGKAVSIPFQIDERDRRDRWVLDQGTKQNPDDVPNVFDENDVIVLMNRDLGRRGDLRALPPGATVWGEVRVGDAAAPLGFAYIGAFEEPPSPVTLATAPARYEETTDRVYAERYALEFHTPLPRHVAFVNKAGELGENVVAGVHAAGEVRFLGGLVTLRKSDADIQTELLGYRNGPVRAIRRARYWIPLPFGFRTTGRVDLLFYRDFVEGTALLKIGIPPSLVLANGELQAYFDFLRQEGAQVLLEGHEASEPVDGRMTSAKRALAGRSARWAALLLPAGRTVLFVVRLEGGLQRLEQRLYFADSANSDPQPGGRPLFGFQFGQVNRLETGTHRLSVFAHILDSTNPEEIRAAAALFLSPPVVTVAPLQSFP
jgi:hypothetical protein